MPVLVGPGEDGELMTTVIIVHNSTQYMSSLATATGTVVFSVEAGYCYNELLPMIEGTEPIELYSKQRHPVEQYKPHRHDQHKNKGNRR